MEFSHTDANVACMGLGYSGQVFATTFCRFCSDFFCYTFIIINEGGSFAKWKWILKKINLGELFQCFRNGKRVGIDKWNKRVPMGNHVCKLQGNLFIIIYAVLIVLVPPFSNRIYTSPVLLITLHFQIFDKKLFVKSLNIL